MKRRLLTIGMRQLRKEARAGGGTSIEKSDRPKKRGQCAKINRPCIYVSCKYNLYIDVTKRGAIVMNFPRIDPDEMGQSCALDVAETGPQTMEYVGRAVNVTRERIRQIEERAKAKLAVNRLVRALAEEREIGKIREGKK